MSGACTFPNGGVVRQNNGQLLPITLPHRAWGQNQEWSVPEASGPHSSVITRDQMFPDSVQSEGRAYRPIVCPVPAGCMPTVGWAEARPVKEFYKRLLKILYPAPPILRFESQRCVMKGSGPWHFQFLGVDPKVHFEYFAEAHS